MSFFTSKAERTMLQKLMNSKHTILLLGNGFDLACGYNTAYRDFYKSEYFNALATKGESCLAQFIKYKNIELNYRERKWADLEEMLWEYSRLFTDIQSTEGVCIEQYFGLNKNQIEGYRSLVEMNKDIWWALNNKVRAMMRLGNYIKPDINSVRFKEEYNQLRNAICKYLDGVVNENTRIQEDDRTRRMYNLVRTWIESCEKCTAMMFNYTSTFKDILTDLDMLASCDVRYLHGECAYGGEGIVVGIDDAMQVESRHGFISKAENEACVRYAFEKDIDHADRYIVFGSALGSTDNWYFRKVFTQNTPKRYEIYYYGDAEQESVCERIKYLSGLSLEEFQHRHALVMIDNAVEDENCDEDYFIEERKKLYKREAKIRIGNSEL